MIVKTKFFGELEISDKDVLIFDEGLPGFQDMHRYAVINDGDNPYISYLQSLEKSNICFIMIPPVFALKDYDIEISDSTVKKLGIEKPEDVKLYAILTIPGSFKDATANLKAPIVVNVNNNKAVQEILDDERYSIRYRIVKESDV
ncbi:MAG TPA: flagellar assembly protein FliW [Bacillota bacterium]|jgi:flagellar assembly factor FliW|nr:flagellar assembly protein FliW [Bacillota bacterium]HQE65592.1 flagellar assembly protein FliW [Bacillota bacterium]HQI16612.1 flagellar assembly protein FliW [Bacillota bacterium]HQL35225.1 flagellar assembly protein FliW [Bacillota bacterium]HRS20188.1 flagellar assembly protein FliW [Clostridia bacterium]